MFHHGRITVLLLLATTSPLVAQDIPKTPPSIDEFVLFQPRKSNADNWKPDNLVFEDVYFESADGTKLHGWYCPVENPRAVVLYLHGNGGDLSWRTRRLRDLQQNRKVSVFIFDYRGYGKSEGIPTVPGAIADAEAARTELARRAAVPEKDVVLLGRSLGGAIAAQLLEKIPPRAVIIQSSFSSERDIAIKLTEPSGPLKNVWWRPAVASVARVMPKDKLNSVARLKQYSGPVLISHGDRDRLIPFSQGRALYDAAAGKKDFFTVRGGGHNDYPTDQYNAVFDQFIDALPEVPPADLHTGHDAKNNNRAVNAQPQTLRSLLRFGWLLGIPILLYFFIARSQKRRRRID